MKADKELVEHERYESFCDECGGKDGECDCMYYGSDDCRCESGDDEEYTCEHCSKPDEEYWRDLLAEYPEDGDAEERDRPQAEKVYMWERKTAGTRLREDLTFDECQELVDKYFRWYRGSEPSPLVGAAQDWSCATADKTFGRIWLPKWARNQVVVLHETAHAITPGGHGPRFARVFIELLAAEGFGETRDLVASAKAAGVKVSAEAPRQRAQATARWPAQFEGKERRRSRLSGSARVLILARVGPTSRQDGRMTW